MRLKFLCLQAAWVFTHLHYPSLWCSRGSPTRGPLSHHQGIWHSRGGLNRGLVLHYHRVWHFGGGASLRSSPLECRGGTGVCRVVH